MRPKELNGDQAFAYGALGAGVKMVTSYPGSPSSGTVEVLIDLAKDRDFYVEWSTNEKVAMEMGIGASIAGRRALVCTKSVGMNVMLDPLMALNLTPVNGGLVILLGDDPGGYGSQNDQDTRPLAQMLEMPMLEPATPAEAYDLMMEAFDVSEQLNTPIIIRETRSFAQQVDSVDIFDKADDKSELGLVRETFRFVPVPINAVQKHRELHERIAAAARWMEDIPYNAIVGSGRKGVVGAGFSYQKLLDVIGGESPGDIRLLKLGSIYPLPEKLIAKFLMECDEVLVVEENEPFLEIHIKAIAYDNECRAKILGKQSGDISREGELFRWQIQEVLGRFIPEFAPVRNYSRENESEERPSKENYCAACRYGEILDVLENAAANLGQKLVLVGDPGCLVAVAERLDAKYALGSAVAVADGISKIGVSERPVALFGDSSFFHTTLPAICNAVVNRSNILMVVLDNSSTGNSGFQPNPSVGKNALGEEAPILSMKKIAHACGVEFVRSVGQDDPQLKDVVQEGLRFDGLGLVVVETLCEWVV